MDPVTAIGLAASIIIFVEFNTRLVSKGGYLNNENKDGALVDQKVLEQLGIQLRRFETELGGIPGTARSRDGEQLARLSEECLAVGKDLNTVLENLRVFKVGKGWGPTRQALRTILNKEKLEILHKRLSCIRDEMQMSMLVSMYRFSKALSFWSWLTQNTRGQIWNGRCCRLLNDFNTWKRALRLL